MLQAHIADVRQTHGDRDVYDPSDDSFALVDALVKAAEEWRSKPPRICVEVGSGSGYITCSVALLLQHLGITAHCISTDINPAALHSTECTLQAHNVADKVDLVHTDLLEGLRPRLRKAVDLLVFNPPYVPTPDEEVLRTGIAQAWAGGNRGRVVIDRFLPMVEDLLSPDGQLFLVTVAENDPEEIIGIMQQSGLSGEVVLRRRADEEHLSIIRCSRKVDRQ
ncbi:S-adenosyl-L-methionine-dependent methyltransferase [Coccomyxa subellipsoidea C-169]|uniref:S-adenosyl-L-methionine-dependent methyltransferase n=1 Tax=Coccomyxa subellipsoidea (strain C-169) TaxID=574566 RepID=I0YS22_COCSC|nr:S-adenosyl-L-methionine-dependent methyltransferase [Coccomyxa subellipsoidea C-169]EIE21191.1 S-adenosyl-L-methionine-dependent methyltransferase [Coccomyxa subellipsoidea C-169]|eukprot:XP_005645735.1 S-adenosyl-L-methionine-dependent methyltransferase [Coccomyxa subellipsoidea C-169]